MTSDAADSTTVLVVSGFPKGSETFIFNKALGLVDRGWNISVACTASAAGEWDNYPADQGARLRPRVVVGAPHRPLRLVVIRGLPTLVRSIRSAPGGTVRYLRRGWRTFGPGVLKRLYLDCHLVALRPDLIHFEFGSLAAERTYLADLLDCRLTVSFRGYDLDVEPGRRDLYENVWRHAAAVHVLGGSVRARARERGAPEDLPCTSIAPGIDTADFDAHEREHAVAGTRERPLRLLTVGRLHWKKGFEYSVDAVRALVAEGLHIEYRIVGDGDLWEALHFWRHEAGLDDVIELLGSLPHEAVVEQMAWADLLVHPAVSEAFGNAVLEAQATGLPVICADAGGLPENVEHGVTGLVVDRRDPTALADAIRSLGNDPDRRSAMGRAGRQRVVDRFDLGTHLDAIEEFYRGALGA